MRNTDEKHRWETYVDEKHRRETQMRNTDEKYRYDLQIEIQIEIQMRNTDEKHRWETQKESCWQATLYEGKVLTMRSSCWQRKQLEVEQNCWQPPNHPHLCHLQDYSDTSSFLYEWKTIDTHHLSSSTSLSFTHSQIISSSSFLFECKTVDTRGSRQ